MLSISYANWTTSMVVRIIEHVKICSTQYIVVHVIELHVVQVCMHLYVFMCMYM